MAQQIILRKYRTQECLFCNSTERLSYFREWFICPSCLGELVPDRQIGDLESVAAYEEEIGMQGKLLRIIPQNKKRQHGESLNRLVEVMCTNPKASQSECVRTLGITQGRVSQLLRAMKSK